MYKRQDDWLSERINAAQYATNWPYNTYGDAQYIEHVMRYYHNDIDYIGAKEMSIRDRGRSRKDEQLNGTLYKSLQLA